MGTAIGSVSAYHGEFQVIIKDVSNEQLNKAKIHHLKFFQEELEKGFIDELEKSTNDTKDEKVTNQVPASPKKRRRKPSKKQKEEKEITTISKNAKFDPERQARR